jgi:hypothetical protein
MEKERGDGIAEARGAGGGVERQHWIHRVWSLSRSGWG